MMPQTLSFPLVRKFFRKRKKDSHKGQNGKALIIGGCEELAGAPALAAMASIACLRSGIDLCTVAAPEKVGWAINSYSPDIIVKKIPGRHFALRHLKTVLGIEKKSDAALVGPGMGRANKTLRFARQLVKKAKGPLVIDADALKACAGMRFYGNAIITPHAKEFEIFSGKKIEGKNLFEKTMIAKEVARKHNCVVLLKGRIDIITDGSKVFLNRTGNAGMTVGGTGDVLAGMCTGLLALGAGPTEAAAAAAYVNGRIGDALYRKMGYSYIASDFIREIPNIIKKLLQ